MAQNNFNQIIRSISFRPKKRIELLMSLPEEKKGFVLFQLSKKIQKDIVLKLKKEDLVNILEHLDLDEATDIVQLLPKRRQKKIIDGMKEEMKKDMEILAKFDPDTAAGIMNLNYIQVEETDNFREVARQFKNHEKRTGRLAVIIVMNKGKLLGHIPVHILGFAEPLEPIKKYVKKIETIDFNSKYKEIISLFKKGIYNKVVVIGESENVIGIIYADDMLRILEEKESESLYDFAGVNKEETVTDTTANKVKSRYKWLMINLGTAFLASFIVTLFKGTISKYVLLAAYMPIIAGMGGNSGTQTLAILVRGITLKQVDFKNAFKILKREMGAGFFNGLINGIIVALIVILMTGNYLIALVLGLALIINLIVAGFFGTIMPLVMKRLGKDPATSATIFITTATDVLGFLVFLGLATLILP